MTKTKIPPVTPTESPPSLPSDIQPDLIHSAGSFGTWCYILGDQRGNKMKLLSIIARHELPVKSISTLLGLSESSTSQHLSRLQAHGVISSTRNGHQTIYRINPAFILMFSQILERVLQVSTLDDVATSVTSSTPITSATPTAA